MRQLSVIISFFISSVLLSQDNNFSGHPFTSLGTFISLNSTQGTARYVGTGGVISTVGGDISNLNTNPAGLAMFSRTELQITPSVQVNNVNSNLIHNTNSGIDGLVNSSKNEYKFTINSIGGVFVTRNSNERALRASNVTVAVNRTHNFNRTTVIESVDNLNYSYARSLESTLNAAYQSNKSAFPLNSFPNTNDYIDYGTREIAAYDGQLLYYNSASDAIESPVTGYVDQNGYKKIKGAINELSIAWSGNIKDKYYMGVSLGIPILNYLSEFEIMESDVGNTNTAPNQSVGNFIRYNLSEFDEYSGGGVNLKFGGLVKLTKKIRASAYIHTPTYLEITNEYQVGMTTEYENSRIERNSQIIEDRFQFITPFKFGGGLSYLFYKRGFIGAEYEFNNIKNTTFTSDNISGENVISDAFGYSRSARHTFRLGGELVLGPGRIRAGYNLNTSPYNSNIISQDGDLVMQTYSLGAGIRGNNTSLDLTYNKNQFRDYNTFYETGTNSEMGISSWNTQNQIMFTLNYRFD